MSGAPCIQQDPKEVNQLIASLEAAVGAKGKQKKDYKCRKTSFDVQGSQIKVHSWKFNDWDYKKWDLPTYARGLFTLRNPKTGNYEICIRGYDKFFNIDEVHKTKWNKIKEDTKAPYELTLKENGCIIFISGMPDGTLLVCSKHSTGIREDVDLSHAMAGEKWVDRQLAAVGKTRKQFAEYLREKNVTAVAELCDDDFEEHILEYRGDKAGLYLHGINLNLPTFTTWGGEECHKFADEWGFRKVEVFYKNNVDELRKFLEEVAETGAWSGRDVEGFVIRCKARDKPTSDVWYDWFFKYKFEEPYLMYRQWREVTKALISGKQPKINKHKKITQEYVKYAARRLRESPQLGKQFMLNHGIIEMRDGFLAERGLDSREIIKAEEEEKGSSKVNFLVLVPIATIGCGKTTVAVGLTNLFDWGHVQNDNLTVRKNKPAEFVNQIRLEFENRNVVIADRNNHQRRERQQLIDDMSERVQGVKFVALHYVHYRDGESLMAKIRQKTEDRVFERGDNHQTISAGSSDKKFVQSIMEGFQQRFEPVDTSSSPDNGFHAVIDLDPLADSRKNLETVVTELNNLFPSLIPEMPSKQDFDEAIEMALHEYIPDVKHVIKSSTSGVKTNKGNAAAGGSKNAQPKQRKVEYFAVNVPPVNVNAALDKAFASESAEVKKFYTQLKNSHRIQPNFHVTMIHNSSQKAMPDLWHYYTERLGKVPEGTNGTMETFQVRLERVIWDFRVMSIEASLVDDKGFKCANDIMHITVGTADPSIKPKESNDLHKKFAGVEDSGNWDATSDLHQLPLGKNEEGVIAPGALQPVYPRR